MNASVQAAFASLFLILAATALGSFASKGFVLDIATAQTECGDSREVVVSVDPDGTVDLYGNGHHVRVADLHSRLAEIFKTRAERVLWLRAEPGVRVEQVTAVMDAASPVVEIISLLTPSVESEARARTGYGCFGISLTASQRLLDNRERWRIKQQ